jgi:hypothetical protein
MVRYMLLSMNVIFVQKSWLETIGDVANCLLIREEQNNCISLLAGKYDLNPPFVDAHLARKDIGEDGECFIPAMIPMNFVSGIFDMTKKETSKYGFHEIKKT